jgi:hypothetical protein
MLVIFALGALAVYASQFRRVIREGGKVRVDALGFPELLMSIVFAGFFALLTASAAMAHQEHPAPEVKIDSVLPNSLLFIIFTVGIAGFIRFRGLPLRHTFGLDQVSPLRALGWACALILAAFPIAAAANALTMIARHGQVEPQPLVDLFNKVAREHDYGAMSKILISAVFIQPVCEEFLFRGFFYGVWKRYLGGLAGALLASLLFAAFHASLTAFAGLFVLAVCLNIAYERTGSLLVPAAMHALFNLTSLLFIYAQAQSSGAH